MSPILDIEELKTEVIKALDYYGIEIELQSFALAIG